MNSTFRNERGRDFLSSELILEAIAATRYYWPDAPTPHGLITFVAPGKVKRKRDPGRCYLRAGFQQLFTYDYGATGKRVPVQTLSEGHLVFQMVPEAMPAACPPLGSNVDLFGAA